MEVTEELRPKTTTSDSPNPNTDLDDGHYKPSDFREEGELSSDEEHILSPPEDQILSASQCNSVDGASRSVPVSPANNSSEEVQLGKNHRNPTSTVDIPSQPRTQPIIAQKIFDKNHIPLKANTHGRCTPIGAANNLVIRFSDDSSDSDSEERIKAKPAETNSNITGVAGTRKPPAPLQSKSSKPNLTTVNKGIIPQRFSFNRTFTSTMKKVAGSNSSGGGTSSVEQGSRVIKNFNNFNKVIPNRERGSSADLNNTKLQDLRQRIALRESELKLKSSQRSKESVPLRDDNATNLQSNANKRFSATSSISARTEPKESDPKRKKVSGAFLTQEAPVGKLTLPSKEPPRQKSVIPVTVNTDQGSEGKSIGRTESSFEKFHSQNEKQMVGMSENIPPGSNNGGNVMTNCIQSEPNSSVLSLALSPANMNSQVSTMNAEKDNVELNPSKSQQPSSFANKGILGNDLVRGSHPEILSNTKMLELPFHNPFQESESRWNGLSNANESEYRSLNMQSLAEMEESLDKDLEEAQELRRRCEIDERNALKAYRKAQRALIEANAKCAELYHKRDMYSAQLRSFVISESSLLCSPMQKEKARIGYSNDVVLLPSSNQLQPEFDGFNPLEIDSNFQYLNNAPVQKSYQHVNGQTVGSEPCSEPDASTSEPLSDRGKVPADGFHSPSNDPNISADEDGESFSFENETVQLSLECQPKNNASDDGENNLSKKPNMESVEKPQDSHMLEVKLRSELVARIGARNALRSSGSSDNISLAIEQGTENDICNEKTQTNLENCLFSRAESDGGGPDGREQSNSEARVEMQDDCSIEADCLNSHALVDPGNEGVSEKEGSCLLFSDVSNYNMFRSAFNHLKIISPKTLMECVLKNRPNYLSDIFDKVGSSTVFDKSKFHNPKAESAYENNVELCWSKVGSYTCDIAVDPFWPLCMYELRGKCNDDECPWQHIRDNKEITSLDQHVDSNGDAIIRRNYELMAPSAYVVGLDTLKIDMPSYESVLACKNNGEGWTKCFSLSLTLPNKLQTYLPTNGTPPCGSDGRIEVNWSRQSSYFLSRSDRLNELKQLVVDNEQTLETAISIFNQETEKDKGKKKVLHVLARSLEDNPTSVFLWMFYLLLFDSNAMSVVADDIFSIAVKHNQGSYELWLMFINSRTHLDVQLATCDVAIRALCRHTSSLNQDGAHTSACILDLFLQMIERLCMSGNVEKAIQKVSELSCADPNSDKSPSLLSDMLPWLTISDKCIFWVCCVYLVIYRKLPDSVVHQLEFDKQLPDIEWPSIVLLDDENQKKAVELMDKGSDCVASLMQTDSIKSDTDLSSAQFLAVNHIRFIAVLESMDCCWTLLGKYLQLFPSCLELVLMSARAHRQDFGEASFIGFEEALNIWPKELPGIQCIWNQYAQLSLQNGLYEFGKELMDRWYVSAWKVIDSQNGVDCESPLSLGQIDEVFGFLNLSLYKLLQSDRIGARIAVDRALKASGPKYSKYCIREHVMFYLTDESLMKDNASIGDIVNVLKHHTGDSQVVSVPEPLPRKFIDGIKKPRVQQLVSNLFSPVSPDFSLVNLVLEVWFGPTLLPEEFKETKDLVDFVELILNSWPSNYVLALSVCNLLTSRNNSTDSIASASMLFWAISNLVTAIFHSVPIPPETLWVEASRILGKVTVVGNISKRFYRRALTVYPFSVNLWRSYQIFFAKMGGEAKTVTEEAKAKGIDLV